MERHKIWTKTQLSVLVSLRFLIGWHLFYEGLSKLLSPNWSSAGFLSESKWVLQGMAEWIIGNSRVLAVADLLNTWGLIAIGIGLIVGLYARTAAFVGAGLLLVYYLNNPPLIGLEYSIPNEGNYLVVSKTLIEAVTLFLLAVFPTSQFIGLDVLRVNFRKNFSN
ncbi:DoxX family membrane protein [Sunxiuqinia elliptica]|uniref:Thiosulfate dehydrogenase [quinone] large subunit n=1 Tax=Sunxiuqinia elliptica TaxID=655355 RepID=A0A1I2GNB3_9BACT|nr:DoxX family membrane protein [Sunxiuqinia elliptica]SFF18176.1 thiosulfate dehydrogenase [quinone] large subunit [Sunxiuqinia elliptica]